MFIGTVQCEIELSQSHPAFKNLRFLLVEAEHEVEWEGAVVAVDTVGAEVGDLVVTALAPLGAAFDFPADLPIDGAVVGIVGSITTPAEDGEDADEAEEEAPAPRSRRGGGGGRRGGRREDASEEAPAPAPREERDADEGESRRGGGRRGAKRDDEGSEDDRRRRRRRSKNDEDGHAGDGAPAPKGGSDDQGDDLSIVWDAPGGSDAGVGNTKRKGGRRRR